VLEGKMKQWVIAGALAGAIALTGSAQAGQAPPQQPTAQAGQAGSTAEKPATAAKSTKTTHAHKPAADTQAAETRAPKEQPNTAQDPTVQESAMALGTVHLPKAVKADNKPLAAGTYQVRLTADQAKPEATGTTEKLERWVEFVKGGKVAGREVVTIVPQNEAKLVQKDSPPASGGSKVQMLKGGDYLRVWINKGGNYYLIHLPV